MALPTLLHMSLLFYVSASTWNISHLGRHDELQQIDSLKNELMFKTVVMQEGNTLGCDLSDIHKDSDVHNDTDTKYNVAFNLLQESLLFKKVLAKVKYPNLQSKKSENNLDCKISITNNDESVETKESTERNPPYIAIKRRENVSIDIESKIKSERGREQIELIFNSTTSGGNTQLSRVSRRMEITLSLPTVYAEHSALESTKPTFDEHSHSFSSKSIRPNASEIVAQEKYTSMGHIPVSLKQSQRPLLSLCCPIGYLLIDKNCTEGINISASLPKVYSMNLVPENISATEDKFQYLVWDPCNGHDKWPLLAEYDEEFVLLRNGSIYKPYSKEDQILNYHQFCLAVSYKLTSSYLALVCDDFVEGVEEEEVTYSIGLMTSIPFLAVTFLVYWLIPELKNLHGLTLRGYVGSLATAYTLLVVLQMISQQKVSDTMCISFAFIIHFSFLASFFWLNVMCFDIWWTFGGFRSLQGSAKQRERKKFLIYSIYAWGCASLITGVCVIMDYLPGIPEYFIKPEFGADSCWFNNDAAKALYFYGPMGVTVFCNICLFISTAMKISQHKKDTAHHLKSSESRRHDDNKQWFNLYLKLFIVMGINWSMEIISWLCKGPQYVWYITDLANSLQGLIIFIIFVWKDKIKRLLLKRFGCHDRNYLSRNSTRSVCHSSASRTCTTSAPLQEKTNPFVTESSRNKITSEESDCV